MTLGWKPRRNDGGPSGPPFLFWDYGTILVTWPAREPANGRMWNAATFPQNEDNGVSDTKRIEMAGMLREGGGTVSNETDQLKRRWRQDMLPAAGPTTRLPKGHFTAAILVALLVFALLVSLAVLMSGCETEDTPGPQESPGPEDTPGPQESPGPKETPGPQGTPGPGAGQGPQESPGPSS